MQKHFEVISEKWAAPCRAEADPSRRGRRAGAEDDEDEDDEDDDAEDDETEVEAEAEAEAEADDDDDDDDDDVSPRPPRSSATFQSLTPVQQQVCDSI